MYQRFHGSSRALRPSDKWQSVPRAGLTRVLQEELDGWHLEISLRRVGTTIRRDQYSVTIRRELPAHEEYLRGFSSKMAALAAGRKRIDLLRHINQRPHHRPRKRWPSQR